MYMVRLAVDSIGLEMRYNNNCFVRIYDEGVEKSDGMRQQKPATKEKY